MNPTQTPSAADLLRSLDAEEAAQAPAPPDELVPLEWTIEVDYRMGDGTQLTGAFVHRVPSVDTERKVAVYAAILRGGQPRTAFSGYENDSIDALAYLSRTLVHMPDWARERGLGDVMDPALLFAVGREATAHRERFRVASRSLRPSTSPG